MATRPPRWLGEVVWRLRSGPAPGAMEVCGPCDEDGGGPAEVDLDDGEQRARRGQLRELLAALAPLRYYIVR